MCSATGEATMTSELGRYAERPDSVGEWEDLLVRLEIVPRVARNAVEDVRDAAAARQVLNEAVEREREAGRLLEAAAGIERGAPGEEMQEDDDPLGRVRRFAGLRARTFAMVQRRGLDVWDWRVEGDGTVYQLLRWLAEHDASLLTRLRAATAAPGGA